MKSFGIIVIAVISVSYLSAEQPTTTQSVVPVILPSAASSPAQQPIQTKMVSGKYEIPVCSTLPLKGEVAILGNQLFDGMTLLFNKIQRESNGLPFTCLLKAINDNADVPRSRQNAHELVKQSPLFLSLLGTEVINALMPSIKSEQILALFPIDGFAEHRKRELKNLVFFRPDDEAEIEALVHYSVNTLDKKKIAIFYEASDWGEGVCEAFKKVMARHRLEISAVATYPQRTLNIAKAVSTIADKAPNAIICVGNARPTYNFVIQILNKGLHKTAILGVSSLIPIQTPLKRSRGLHIVTTSVVPNPRTSTLAIAKEYRENMKKYFPNKTPAAFSFEGYINASLLVEALKLITPPFTAEKIRSVFERLTNVRFKGLSLKFDSTTRALSHTVWLNTDEGKEWVLSEIRK